MPRLIGVASAALVFGAIAWSLQAVLGEGHMGGSAAALVAVDVILLTLVAVVGLLMVRGRWARYLAIGVLALQLSLIPALERASTTWLVAALLLATLGLFAGPWLRARLRHHPAAGGPPLPALMLLLGLLTTPALAGLAAPGDTEPAHVALAVAGPVLSLSVGRAHKTALWVARLGFPLIGAMAALESPPVGAVAVTAVTVALTALAWRREVVIAVSPLVAVPGGGYRIPPELAPPEILEAAGLDEHGKRKL